MGPPFPAVMPLENEAELAKGMNDKRRGKDFWRLGLGPHRREYQFTLRCVISVRDPDRKTGRPTHSAPGGQKHGNTCKAAAISVNFVTTPVVLGQGSWGEPSPF